MADGDTRNLDKALFEAQQAIDGVGKSSRNDFHKYQYVSAESMLAQCRPVLHSAGLLIRRDSFTVDCDAGTMNSAFTVTHVASNESRTFQFPWAFSAQKERPMDKAIAGALTTSLNYWLRDLLMIPRMDENEMDRRNDREFDPAPKKRKAVPAAPPPAEPPDVARAADAAFLNRRSVSALADEMGPVWLSRVLKKCSTEIGRACASLDEITDDQVVRILKHHEKEVV
jgi:hypothetical protein